MTLGCPKNLVDSEVMAGLIGRRGCDLTSDLDDADGILVNTCAFIGPAREEAWANLAEAARRRREGPCRALVVAGCLPQGFPAEVRARFPDVDRLLGTGQVELAAEVMAGLLAAPRTAEGDAENPPAHGGDRPDDFGPPGYLPRGASARLVSTPSHYAYLKVAEGCSHRCAFCLIPRLRGPYRSRPPGEVVAEARALEAMGVRELVLVAQDTTAYGRDLGTGLGPLVRQLLAETGLDWIRVLYGYPSTLPADFIDLMAAEATSSDYPRLCRYLDLPMQHASDRVLGAMHRPETRAALTATIAELRRRVPGIVLRSSFILGFPGETEADVQELLDFLSQTELDHAGFFAFSRESGTAADGLPDQVPEAVREERVEEAALVQREIARRRRRRWVGRRVRILVDAVTTRGGRALSVIGRTEGDAPEIDGRVVVAWLAGLRAPSRGDFVAVEITRSTAHDLGARPVALPDSTHQERR